MTCSYCNAEIPSKQAICPVCYQTTEAFLEKSERKPQNTFYFLSLKSQNEFCHERIKKHLQPQYVGSNFYADTEEAFTEITSGTAEWNLLLVDPERIETSATSIERFRAKNPECTIAVLVSSKKDIRPIANAIVLLSPSDLDPWLLMMHALLRQA